MGRLKMKKLVVALPFTLFLTSCGAPSVEELIENPEKLGKVIQECTLLMSQGKSTDTEECNNAIEAQKQMTGNMMKGLMKQYGR